MGIARGSLYYQSSLDQSDTVLKDKIYQILVDNPWYGYRRITYALNNQESGLVVNKKKILRIMNKYDIRCRYRRKKPYKHQDMGNIPQPYDNKVRQYLLQVKESESTNTPIKLRPNHIWATDFTYLRFRGVWIYLATVIDIYTKEIVAHNIASNHSKELINQTYLDALQNQEIVPAIIHSDQGSEYTSYQSIDLLNHYNIHISMSKKASPWENGYQESFYSQFKLELGNINRFNSTLELTNEINKHINYHNTTRIHTTLKMSPYQFKQKWKQNNQENILKKSKKCV